MNYILALILWYAIGNDSLLLLVCMLVLVAPVGSRRQR